MRNLSCVIIFIPKLSLVKDSVKLDVIESKRLAFVMLLDKIKR